MSATDLYLRLMKQVLTRLIDIDINDEGRDIRERGLDWPPTAETMVGLKRLDNIQHCVESVLSERIEGDLIETGVWRGGADMHFYPLTGMHAHAGGANFVFKSALLDHEFKFIVPNL